MAANQQAKRKAILAALKAGNTRRAAAAAAGIHHDTFYEWLKQPTFSDDVKKAEAEAEMEAVKIIRKAGEESWQALAWWLERWEQTKHSWRKLEEIDWRKLSTEQLLAVAAELERRVESAGDLAAVQEAERERLER